MVTTPIKKINVTLQDDRIILSVGGSVRTLDYTDRFAKVTLSDASTGKGFVEIEFSDEINLPRPETNAADISLRLPNRRKETEETKEETNE